jgi:hypothetical protein
VKAAIDRIEARIAVLIPREDETLRIQVPVSELPPGSREGDIVSLLIERESAATEDAKGQVADLISRLNK